MKKGKLAVCFLIGELMTGWTSGASVLLEPESCSYVEQPVELIFCDCSTTA